jgi:hypothetical protein
MQFRPFFVERKASPASDLHSVPSEFRQKQECILYSVSAASDFS